MANPSISLATLTLKLKDAASPYDKVWLDKFDGATDLYDVFLEILSTLLKKPTLPTMLGDLVQITRLEQDERYIKGIFETGKTGTEQDIMNATTKGRSYRTVKDDAVMMPHYFLFYLPENHHKAVLFLQRFKQSGIQTLLLEYLERNFKTRFQRFSFETNYLTDTNTFNQMLEDSRVKEVRLTETEWSSDRADQLDGAGEKHGGLSITYKPYYKSSFPYIEKIRLLAAKKLDVDKVLETEFSFIKPDEASFVITRNGKDRRISFADSGTNFRSYYDITNDVETGNSGYPIFESIDKIAIELLSELSQGLYESPGN